MVMATTQPSPQQVGREFVRQYYTVLHEAPEVLHRFYSSESTFVHGGVDRAGHVEEILKGQIEIDRKIQELSFKDCHTKIRQVDAQATISDAVVVQVTGELSNNGEPMRRFMQTFVLVAQTPKKFYVHNDIFRYQDEVYNDDNEDCEVESVEQQQQAHLHSQQQQQQQQQSIQTNQNEASTNTNSNQYFDQGTSPSMPRHIQHHQEQHLTNGHSSDEETVQESSEQLVDEQEQVEEEETIKKEVVSEESEEFREEATPKATSITESEQVAVVDVPPKAQEPQVKSSWARVTATNSQPLNTTIPAASKPTNTMPTTTQPIAKPKETLKLVEKPKVESSLTNGKRPNRPPRDQATRDKELRQQPQIQQQQQQQQVGDSESEEKNKRYPDTQQIFVGNLQPEMNESDLKLFFSQFGNVVEVRINYNNKQQSGRRLPNYGFIVFDKVDTVQDLLRTSRPFLNYVNDKGAEHRLNIEEKRARNQMPSGNQMQQERRPYNRQNRSSSNNGNSRQSTGGTYQKRVSANQSNGPQKRP